MCLILITCRNVLTISLTNEIYIWSTGKNFNVHVYDKPKDFSIKYYWSEVIDQLRRCDLIGSFAMLGYPRHVTNKNIWRHNMHHIFCWTLLSILCKRDFEKYFGLKSFFVDSKITVFQPYFRSGTPWTYTFTMYM